MSDIYEEILQLKKSGSAGVLITVVDKEGSSPADIGAKMLVLSPEKTKGTVGGGALEKEALKEAIKALKRRKSLLLKYSLGEDGQIVNAKKLGMMCGGNATLFYEYIGAKDKLYIFGAGHIGKALLYHLKNQNHLITIIDNRESTLADIEDFSKIPVSKILASDYQKLFKEINPSDVEGSYVIVATHSHDLDYKVLKGIYQSEWKPKYIGVIGSLRKAETMVKNLLKELGKGIDLDILYIPVGLDIGGNNPDEIAVSIISEIQSLRYGKRDSNHMRIDVGNQK